MSATQLDCHAERVVARRKHLLELAQIEPPLPHSVLAERTGYSVRTLPVHLSSLRAQGHRIPYREYRRRAAKPRANED